jgi:hypothetical protein
VAGDPSPTVDEIDFSLPGASVITLGSTLPDIASDMSINGLGASQLKISGNDDVQVLVVSSGATASISDLSIADGLCDAACGSQGGGVLNEGTLTLDGVTVTANEATDSGGSNAFAEGGGIENNGGTLTITDSLVSANTASASGASNQSGADGGAIMNRGTLTLSRSTVSGNAATANAMGGAFTRANGGAMSNIGALTLRRSTVVGNSATGVGGLTSNAGDAGAIANFNLPSVDLTVDRSTLSLNVASRQGGGLTIFGGGTASVTGSTFSHNSAAFESNVIAFSNTTFRNTIVSNPLGGGTNCSATVNPPTSAGHNLEDGSAPGTCGFTQPTDLHADPMLDAVADNGGPTTTRALLAGSPAIDAGRSFGATSDQRGEPRPFDFDSIANASGGDAADIGAFEVQGTPVATDVELAASKERVRRGHDGEAQGEGDPVPGASRRHREPLPGLEEDRPQASGRRLQGDLQGEDQEQVEVQSQGPGRHRARGRHLEPGDGARQALTASSRKRRQTPGLGPVGASRAARRIAERALGDFRREPGPPR